MTLERPMFPPSRRGFLTLVGGASAAAAASISQPAFAAPAETLDSSKASPALRDAVNALADSHDSLEAAKARFAADDLKMAAWSELHPQPNPKNRRAQKKYWKRWHGVQDATVGESWAAQLEAEKDFQAAQLAVAKITPRDARDLALMAAAAVIYDEVKLGMLNFHPISRRVAYEHLRLSGAFA